MRAGDRLDGGRRARGGFTLLELLTVIAIMVILMSLAGASYYGLGRSAGIRGAISNLRGTLSLARQFAVTHRARTYVLFSQDGTNAHYIVCVQDGAHVGENGADNYLVDGPRWEPGALAGGTLYNLTTGKKGEVVTNGTLWIQAQTEDDPPQTLHWNTGDKGGWVIRDQQHLPLGLAWGDDPGQPMVIADVPVPVIFLPDGSTPLQGNADYKMDIKEVRGTAHVRVIVEGLTGKISVEEDL